MSVSGTAYFFMNLSWALHSSMIDSLSSRYPTSLRGGKLRRESCAQGPGLPRTELPRCHTETAHLHQGTWRAPAGILEGGRQAPNLPTNWAALSASHESNPTSASTCAARPFHVTCHAAEQRPSTTCHREHRLQSHRGCREWAGVPSHSTIAWLQWDYSAANTTAANSFQHAKQGYLESCAPANGSVVG